MSDATRALAAVLAEVRKSEKHAQLCYDRWERMGRRDEALGQYWLGKLAGLARARQTIHVEIGNVIYAESLV